MFRLIIQTFTLSVILESMGFFYCRVGHFFSVYTREPKPLFFTTGHVLVTILWENLENFFSSLLTFSGTILTYEVWQ